MSRLPALAIASALAAAALTWVALRGPGPQEQASSPVAARPAADRRAGGSSAAAPAAAPSAPGGMLRTATLAPVPKATLANEFVTARNYKALHDRLAHSPEGLTAEGQYVLYRILRACAGGAQRPGRVRRPATEEERQEFADAIPDTDPYKAKRLAAWEQSMSDKCVGLTGLVTTEAELAERLRNAAASGDPKARALQVQEEFFRSLRAQNERGERTRPSLSDAQVATLKEVMSSKDPEAILSAAGLLSFGMRGTSLLIGPDQEVADRAAFHNAARLLACDYGYACGENNPDLVEGCALRGHCAAGNLADYIGYYESSANSLQLQERYRSILRGAVESGDWSAITVRRGARGPR